MNNFNIVNEKNEFIPFEELDEEAALLWHKRLDKKYLANPFRESSEIAEETLLNASWFALFNTRIVTFPCTWESLVRDIMSPILDVYYDGSINLVTPSEKSDDEITRFLEYLKPYVALINFWKNKGYKIQKG